MFAIAPFIVILITASMINHTEHKIKIKIKININININ